MKIIGRTMVVLLAALLVCGVTWGIGRNVTATGGPRGEGERSGQFQPRQDGAPQGRGERGRPEGMGGFFGIVQIIQPLVIIGVLVAAGQFVLRMLRRRFPTGAERARRRQQDVGGTTAE